MSATGSATNWRSAGACRSADPDLFFPISSVGPAQRQITRAKLICGGGGVRQEGLDFPPPPNQTYGISGGTTPEDRPRARPRQSPAPPAPPREVGGRRTGRGRLLSPGPAARDRIADRRRRHLAVSQRSMQASSSSVSTGLVT